MTKLVTKNVVLCASNARKKQTKLGTRERETDRKTDKDRDRGRGKKTEKQKIYKMSRTDKRGRPEISASN